MKTTLTLQPGSKSLLVTPNNLLVESEDKVHFYVPEQLVRDINICDIPEHINLCLYDYFNAGAEAKSNHVPVIIAKESNEKAAVFISEQIGMSKWHYDLGGILYPKLKKDLILKYKYLDPQVYFFEEQQYGLIEMEYYIIVQGETIKEVVAKAVEFDDMIENSLNNVLSKVPTACRAKLCIP